MTIKQVFQTPGAGGNRLDRRAFMGAAVVIPFAGPLAAGTTQTIDTPILALYRQLRAIVDAASAHQSNAIGSDQNAEYERLFFRQSDKIERQLMSLPCTCAADFAAKMIVDTCDGVLFSDWETGEIWKEARRMVGEPT